MKMNKQMDGDEIGNIFFKEKCRQEDIMREGQLKKKKRYFVKYKMN